MKLMERDQVGKVQSYESIVANVDKGELPITSMLPKGSKPTDTIHNWQVEQYRAKKREGVPDGKDEDKFNHNKRFPLQMVVQKFREGYGISDLSTETKVHGVPSELAAQALHATVTLKRAIEMQVASDSDARLLDDGVRGTEFRGAFAWLQEAAQANLPVPEDFRPGGTYTGTLAALTENLFNDAGRTAYKERKGKAHMHGFVGIDLHQVFNDFLTYRSNVANKTVIQQVNMSQKDKTYVNAVSRMECTWGSVDLFPHSFLRHDINGEEGAGSHISGLFMILNMWSLHYSRAPRRVSLEDKGGGPRGFVDAIATLCCKNPLGQFAATINS